MKQLLRARPRHDAKERKRKDAGVYVRKVEHHRPRQKARAGAVRKDAGGARASEHGAVHFRAGNVDLRAQVWVTHRFLERGARVGLREVNLVASVRREHALAAQHRATEVPVRFGQILVASPQQRHEVHPAADFELLEARSAVLVGELDALRQLDAGVAAQPGREERPRRVVVVDANSVLEGDVAAFRPRLYLVEHRAYELVLALVRHACEAPHRRLSELEVQVHGGLLRHGDFLWWCVPTLSAYSLAAPPPRSSALRWVQDAVT
mmetsp:Transcript_12408/g.37283  ORF Transcript_12408/g.37283 Transcript_12408/m.37283 type:complete len:265 (+) Transcript_12408:505-1299(+)